MIKRIEEFHASIINSYASGCALATKFEYVLGEKAAKRPPYLIYGTMMHLAMEELHNAGVDAWPGSHGSELVKNNMYFLDLLRNCLRKAEFEHRDYEVPVSWPDDPDAKDALKNQFIEEGSEILANYCRISENRRAKVLISEQEFTVHIGKYMFKGIIDQVREHPDGKIELLDFKTSKRMPSQNSFMRSYQFAVYALALRDGQFDNGDQFGSAPNIITWYHLRDLNEYVKPTPIEKKMSTESTREWWNQTANYYTLDEIRTLTGNNKLNAKSDKVYFNTGHTKGPGAHSIRWTDHWLDVMEKNIIHACSAMRMDKYPINPSYCGNCRFADTCDMYMHGYDKKFVKEQSFFPDSFVN